MTKSEIQARIVELAKSKTNALQSVGFYQQHADQCDGGIKELTALANSMPDDAPASATVETPLEVVKTAGEGTSDAQEEAKS